MSKNCEECKNEDPNKKGKAKVEIGIPKTRWCYNPRRIRRATDISSYAVSMELQTADTLELQLEWATKRMDFIESLAKIRFETWIK